jgi:glycogen synthase
MTTDTMGGVWTYAIQLSRGLVSRGVEVFLATMGGSLLPSQREEAVELGPRLHLCESRFRLEWMEEPWTDVAVAGRWLLALEQMHKPDVVHLNGYTHAALPWASPVLVAAHSCVFSWWHAVKRRPPPRRWAVYRDAVAAGLAAADLVVAPSAAMLDEARRHYGPIGPAKVIHNGIEPDAEEPPRAKEPSILCVGRLWDEAKNASVLAAIAARLPWPVKLAGETRRPDGGEVSFDGVTLLGRRSAREIRGEYRRARIYALPARYEPFGLSVLEAASAGCALVLGDIKSLREIWRDAALFVPPDDPEALRRAIAALIADDARREALSRAARAQAETLTATRMTDAYCEAYAALSRREAPVTVSSFPDSPPSPAFA